MKKNIYLIANPVIEQSVLLHKIEMALEGGLFAVQLWNNWQNVTNKIEIISSVHQLTQLADIPLILNEGQDCLDFSCFEGIHLDFPNDKIKEYRQKRPNLIWGLTCSNETEKLVWAEQNSLDYVSYCSVFPSKTSNSCELVSLETIQRTRQFFSKKVFLAGGINQNTIPNLKNLPFDGIALVSAIMDAENPTEAVLNYSAILND
ncbi:thiamine phosphate synthase [Emticicia sp. W12TSBA100-4]|uniref:thiamine phosphate synthase n=1 Tax=Emticicia sp. W12TSBA100-4 TaxID=3160965 RepID=UPI003305E8C0